MSDHLELWIFRRLRPTNLLRLSQPQTRCGSLYLLPVLSLAECDNHIILTKFQGSITGMEREGAGLRQLSNQSYFVACYASAHVQGPAAPGDLSRFSEPHCHYYATAPDVPRGSITINPAPSGTCPGNDRHLSEISALIYLLPDGQCFS
jgi:hypothetical protein